MVNSFNELKSWANNLPNQVEGLSSSISETGEPCVVFAAARLARSGDEKVVESLAAALLLNLEKRCLEVEKKYNELRAKLVDLLLPEQIEAAATCGCSPEEYALEWIQVHFRDARTNESKMAEIK